MSAVDVQPFRLAVPEEVLDDLRERLDRTRFPGAVRDAGWDYGTDPDYLRDLLAYWRDGFDWRAAERALNAIPQFTADVDGVDLHFARVEGVGPAPLPLLFSHGWPGSFWEVHKVLGPLTDPGAHGGDPRDAFTVVAPSLPGYGFSPDPGRRGLGPAAIGDLYAGLMEGVLGHRRFGAQGGDWGAHVLTRLAHRHPHLVTGLHLNLTNARPHLGDGARPLSSAESDFLDEQARWRLAEGAYAAIQGTKPQTLAYALTDSPAGLLAWIVEKFRAWSDCDGDVERAFTRDELLTNVMIYWVTGCIGSSIRLYYERDREAWVLGPGERVEVPTGFARFPAEIWRPPREWVERSFDLRRWTEMPRGGHFAALEEPALLVEDVRAFFRPLR